MQADGHIRLGHRDGGKIGLTQCAERSWLPGLPPSRINGSGSSYRLCNAGLCHFFFHFSRVASLNAPFLFLRGMTPSSCHAPKAKNGQFRPVTDSGEFLAELWNIE